MLGVGELLSDGVSFVFNADMTYSTMGTSTIDFDLNVPSSCIQGRSCAVYGDGIRAAIAMDPAGSQGTTATISSDVVLQRR